VMVIIVETEEDKKSEDGDANKRCRGKKVPGTQFRHASVALGFFIVPCLIVEQGRGRWPCFLLTMRQVHRVCGIACR
jgi:hypothetical protein